MNTCGVYFLLNVLVAQISFLRAASLAALLGESKIVNGERAPFGIAPYVVALTVGNTDTGLIMFCGGTVVTTRSILTAAHCITAVTDRADLIGSLRATVGTNFWKSGGQTYSVSHNITHPQYDNSIVKNDVGLMYTATDIVLSRYVKLAPLDFDYVYPGLAVKVFGWGRTALNGNVSDSLQELTATTIDMYTCMKKAADVHPNDTYSIEYSVEICTFRDVHKATCNGDSGSPLTRVDRGTVIGCVSWGFYCGAGGPDMFTRFSAFKDWIYQHMSM